MSKNVHYLIPNISKPLKLNRKSNTHSLSPNIKQIQPQQKKIRNDLFPKNNNNNFNIKVNKIRLKKEKIIEGELNFEDDNKKHYYILNHNSKQRGFINNNNNNITKQQRKRMPNKSPIPIRGMYKSKNIFSFNNLFNSNNNKYLTNEQKYNQNLIKNYLFINNNSNLHFSKTHGLFYRKKERNHTPILRTNNNRPLIILGNNKSMNRVKRESKSPNLGKSFNFKRNDNIRISLHSSNNDKRYKYINDLNINNYNNMNNKVLKGNMQKEPFSGKRINNINNININNNFKFNKGVNIVNINLRPISHNNLVNTHNNKNKVNLFDEEINMALLKMNNNNNNNINNNIIIERNKEKDNNNNNIVNNIKGINSIRKIERPKSPKNNPNKNSLRNKSHIIINENNIEKDKNNNEENKIKISTEENKDQKNNNINNNKNNNSTINSKEIKKSPEEEKEEIPSHKKLIRSHSQSPIDPLNNLNNNNNKNLLEDSPKENKKFNKKVFKKIKDIYEFSHVGFDGEEPKENNQDNYFIYRNFADHKDYIYLSVCDGHGIEGHFVSDFIKDVLPFYMSENLKNVNILTDKTLSHQIIEDTFILVNNMLISNENINSLFSGSTCISVIFTPEKLIVPNIGDSRAVLARYDNFTKKYKAIELSRDHKPTEKDEAKRIIENDGRIQPFTEEGEFVGPQRVWLKDEEVPGLAMTRSFGDRVAATVGVVSNPEIKEFDFDENDKFMIIASDGIWEFISSQECVDIIKDFYERNDMKGCAEHLYEESSRRWLKEEEVIDDTTLILVFFD